MSRAIQYKSATAQWRPYAWLAGALLTAACAALDRGPAGRGASAGSDAGQLSAEHPPTLDYARDVQPLLRKYCIDCHGGEKPKAQLALDRYQDAAAAEKDRKVWQKIARNIRTHEMPPKNMPQPTQVERDRIVEWIDATLTRVDCRQGRDPGRVTIRRLNRAEYRNTIRDLVGFEFPLADDFPLDDVGYGFDNIGDVLALSPLLVEKFFSAAEKIMEQAIVLDSGKPARKRIAAADMESTAADNLLPDGDYRGLYSNGSVSFMVDFPHDGDYQVRIQAYGQQAGPDPARMTLRVGRRSVKTFDVAATHDKPETYEARVNAAKGPCRLVIEFINDYFAPNDPDPKKRGDRNLFIGSVEISGPAKLPPLPESHRRIMIAEPVGKDTAAAARTIIENFAFRAYRRPTTKEEINRLMKIFALAEKNGERFERCIQITLTAVLVSPHFLFKIEIDKEPDNPTAVHPINEFEQAVRLSYFLWSSMPDDELFDLAKKGLLRKDGNLEKQVRRMLKDPKARALTENFAGQWLQIRNLTTLAPDPEVYKGWDDALRSDMIRETELFFDSIVAEDRSVLDFLDAEYSFLNERLAKHYGIAGVQGKEFRRVELKGGQRSGILTHASVLTVTSNPTRTSPVKRGKYILENILGTPPPPPPPGAGDLPDGPGIELQGTLRQRMEKHRADPNCATCHQRMDPLGFALENYDGIGRWRTKDGNFDIDAAGELPDGRKFNGPVELKAILRQREKDFSRCLTEKMLTYALGRGLEYYDKCAVDDIVAALAKDGYKFSTLVVEIARSDPFQKRRGKRDE
jgi:mono/diheme cytochrome c family protein